MVTLLGLFCPFWGVFRMFVAAFVYRSVSLTNGGAQTKIARIYKDESYVIFTTGTQ